MPYDADAENECERRDKCNWDPLCPGYIDCWLADGGHPDDIEELLNYGMFEE